MIARLFTNHPAHVNETYLEHAGVAARFSLTLFTAAFAALVHAVIPGLCERTASRLVAKLHDQLQARH
ncbi:MAG: DUF6356 family protein [Pseudomonadota bacterium]